jgi:diguanylate cyclase (GGDEF)-like protein/PAS domain S-box-containing protein
MPEVLTITHILVALLALGAVAIACLGVLHVRVRRELRLLRRTTDHMTQGLVMFDQDLDLVVTNRPYLDMYGMSPEIVRPGCNLRTLLTHRTATNTFHDDIDQYVTRLRRALDEGVAMSADFDAPDGRTFCVTNKPLPEGGWVATHEDVTSRRRAERELDRTRNFLNAIVDNIPEILAVKSARDGNYVFVNRAGEQFYGFSRHEMLGRTAFDFFPPEYARIIAGRDQEAIRNGRLEITGHSIYVRGKNLRFVDSKRIPILGKDGTPEYLLTVLHDVTERREAERRIVHLAHHDPLTDLPNRAAFNAKLGETIAANAASGGSFGLLCLDLDHFKEVNDLFGHATGDSVLLEIARRITEASGDAFVSRVGGDEFILIAGGENQPEAAHDLALALVRALGDEIECDGRKMRTGLSVGCAIYPKDGADAATLLRNADAALYRAKAEGRGVVRFFEAEMDRVLHDRRELQNDLGKALARNELTLHYQPQAKIDGTIVGFEALLRWEHPKRGFVPPDKFIPLAEECGLIGDIGEWVMREACREAASWRKPLQIAINLSPLQFRQGDLATTVHGVLLETGLAPERLVLEITEGALMDDFSRALSVLRRVKTLGVRIAMDDFGTGYSSLSYLQSFPFDKIKIDQTFISNLERNAQSAAIVRAVLGLGKNLNLLVVAEGVETNEQWAILRREHCDEVQGYLIGRPCPIGDYARLVGRASAPPRARNIAISA